MVRPPPSVVLVARTHWLVTAVVLISTGLLTWAAQRFPVEFGVRTYAIVFSIAGLYLVAGVLVWFGLPLGRFFSRVCCLLYLSRPRLGSYLWELMSEPEFQGHFKRRGTATAAPASPRDPANGS